MKKKIFGLLLAFTLILGQAVSVLAAPSAQVPPTGGGNYGDDFTDVVKDKDALKVIDYVNNTDASNSESIDAINDNTSLNLDGGVLVTDFVKVPDYTKDENGYTFDVYVPNLPDNVKREDIRGIVFYNENGKWDVVVPVKLNGKTLTFTTPYKPSAIIIYFPTTSTTTSPVTGVVSGLGLTMSLAAVATTVSAIANKKSKED